MNQRFSKYIPLLLALGDLVLLNASFRLGYWVKFQKWAVSEPYYIDFWIYANCAYIIIALLFRQFSYSRIASILTVVRDIFTTQLIYLLSAFAYFVVFKAYYLSREHLFLFYILFLVGLVISRGMVNAALHNYRKRGFSQRNVLLLGKGTLTDQLRNLIVSNPEYGYKLHEADYSTGADAMETIESYLHEHHIDEIYCALGEFEPELVYELMELTDRHLVNLNLFPDYRRVSLDKVRFTYIDHFPLISVSNEPLANRLNKWSKRLFDIAISALVLLLASPIFALVALITKLSSPGPVVFSQERVGQSRRPFRIYKFRSMKVNAEQQGPGLSSDNDPRITPWGRFMRKTRLDELPQFYNVLVGDMSIVGPRPERQFFIDQIVAKSPHYKKLHRLKPGITSLGQVKFGYAENVPQMLQRLRYDILYVENWSLLLDLRIIFMTIGVVVQGRGK